MAFQTGNLAQDFTAELTAKRGSFELDSAAGQDREEYERQARLREDDSLDEVFISDEIRATTRRAIDRLPEEVRTTIFLHELDGLSYEEIAVTMDCSLAAVRSRIVRARAAIDAELSALLK